MKRFNSKQAEGYTPYTCIQALRQGSAVTRLSALVLDLGNMLNGQLIKGLLFLAGELAYIFFMIRCDAGDPGFGGAAGDLGRSQSGVPLYQG